LASRSKRLLFVEISDLKNTLEKVIQLL